MTAYTVFTLAERPELIDAVNEVSSSSWPEFMLHDAVADEYFGYLYSHLNEFQVVLVDDNGAIIAAGNTIPFVWDGTTEGLPLDGWDAVMKQGVTNHQNGITPNMLSAIQAVVAPNHLGKGLSQHILQAMKAVAARHGFNALVAPVRPNLKHRYPLTPMERYIQWKLADESPFDPWIRTHWKIGAEIVRVCPLSMTISSTVIDWETWTEMRFPESGSYVVPGALVPVEIDREMDIGRYVEPNVWMRHPVDPK
jgi:GNAT superfamily N-acetyltransferase